MNSQAAESPFGTWASPITAAMVAEAGVSMREIAVDGGDVYWLEGRPDEAGRQVIVRRSADGAIGDVNPAPFNARSRVHEYGGGHFVVVDGQVYFANYDDQRLYVQEPGGEPRALTPAGVDLRYADCVVDRPRHRLICVREDHTGAGEAVNTIVAVSLEGGGGGEVLFSGTDFAAAPRLSPDNRQLAWISWDHPNMPWDATTLWLADIAADGSLENRKSLAGPGAESVIEPSWSPDGRLYFISDRSGWWNLYRWRDGEAELVHGREADFAGPSWGFDNSSYAFTSERSAVVSFVDGGLWRLARLDLETGDLKPVDTGFVHIGQIKAVPGGAVFIGGSETASEAVVRADLARGSQTVLYRPRETGVDQAYISRPEAIAYPTEGGLTAHALYYPPANPDHQAPAGELPPLLVKVHGGPTGAVNPTLDLSIQFWTSRGFAVANINYGGSSGYGRAYRQRLDGKWGVVDVDDSINAVRYLVAEGRVDKKRLAIRGGSAGGFTTLAALAFRDVFSAGANYYGVSDLVALARDTHKFESRYLDRLIGPYPEAKAVYDERSPINFIDGFSVPLIVFQGLEDQVVPPSQSEMIVEALRAKGIPVAYLPFAGEQHGFRRARNIIRSLEAELYFYGRIFGFAPADAIEPVAIDNLPAP